MYKHYTYYISHCTDKNYEGNSSSVVSTNNQACLSELTMNCELRTRTLSLVVVTSGHRNALTTLITGFLQDLLGEASLFSHN